MVELFNGCIQKVEVHVTNEELEICQVEGGPVIVGILSQSEEEEESKDNHVCRGSQDRIRGLQHSGQEGDASYDLNWDGLDLQGCWIRSFPCF